VVAAQYLRPGARLYPGRVDVRFSGPVWEWRGPAPYHFVTVPDEQCGALEAVAPVVSYGWGMIPVRARIGGTEWTTSLFPKDGTYVIPLKDAVRKAEGVAVGDVVTIRLDVEV
jgi:hypothetical protein